jgi:carboxymethylenebutenolidase
MDQKIIDLYDTFTHGGMHRREFMTHLTSLAGSAGAALALLPVLQNNYAQAAFTVPDDPRLAIERIAYDWPKGKVSAYLARPKGNARRPAVLVIHENRGINPHIEDVARRLALEGFLALAPDLLSVSGGTPPIEDQARELYGKTSREEMLAESLAGVVFLKTHPESTGKVGGIGFCAGGSILNRVATESPELDAASVYYGDAPPADKVSGIRAALLLHYASLDKRVNAGIAGYEAALTANKKRFTVHMYEGANHSFNADVNAARYHKPSADLAWTRTLAFFREHLGAPPSAS